MYLSLWFNIFTGSSFNEEYALLERKYVGLITNYPWILTRQFSNLAVSGFNGSPSMRWKAPVGPHDACSAIYEQHSTYTLQQNTMDLILKIKDATMTGLESSLKFRDQVERRGKLMFSGRGGSGLGLWRGIHWLVVWTAPGVIADLFHDSLHSLGLIKCLILNIAMKSV